MAKSDELKARIGLSGPPLERFQSAPPGIPDHEMVRRIGQGSYGEVWLARNAVGTWRAVKIIHRDHFKDARPYEREFIGLQKYEPISRSNEGLIDILQIGRNDAEGYFYYVMELADDASAEGGERRAELALTRPAATLSHPTRRVVAPSQRVGEGSGEGGNSQLSTLNSQPLFDPATYIPKTLACAIRTRGRLPVEECITLGLTLNLALSHLHHHGLIHRDVKPSNIIFVNGVPKLADIGLVTDLAEAQSFVGTEGFIPPEGPNSPQADLYALGKVLYEAAMGKDRHEFPEPFTEGLGSDAGSSALMELNAILLKACAPSPKHRYRTAEEMNADLALLHSGQSVRDKHALQRRLKIMTRLAVAVVAAMVLGVVPYYLAIKEARLAKKEAAKSQQVAQFLKYMLRGVGPSLAMGRDTKMLREILDQTAEHIGKDLTNQPEVEVELRDTLARTYQDLGLYKQMESMARATLDRGRSRWGAENLAVAGALFNLGVASWRLGNLEGAETLSRQALVMRRKLLGKEHPDVAEALNVLGDVLSDEGKLVEAGTMLRDALAMRRRVLGNKHMNVAASLNDLAANLFDEGKWAEAESMWREALAMKKELMGRDNPQTSATIGNLAGVLRMQGKLAESESFAREALEIDKRIFGNESGKVAESLRTLASTLADLTLTLLEEEKFAEAEAPARECLVIREAKLPDDWRTFNGRTVLGGSLLGQEKYVEAEALLVSGYEGMKQREDKIPAGSKPCLKEALQRLVQLYEATGRSDQTAQWKTEVTKWYRKEVEQYRKAADSGDVQTLNGLAWLLATCVDSEIRDGRSAVTFAEKAVAATNRKDPAILDTLAAAYAEAGEFAKAVGVQQEAIALLDNGGKIKEDFASRLKLYESNSPYRER